MGYAVLRTRAAEGIDAPPVQVEVHLSNGLPRFDLVGMAETSVKEARDRVRSALINSGFEFPARRITVNLAPATVPKAGSRYDLPIAVGILAAAGMLDERALAHTELIGELGLDGTLKAITGLVPALLAIRNETDSSVIFPAACVPEGTLVDGIERYPALSLLHVFHHFSGTEKLQALAEQTHHSAPRQIPRWDDIIGQQPAKRALLIAASGAHNLLFVGPPGTGKSLLASRLLSLLPELSIEEALEVAAVHSVKGLTVEAQTLFSRPFRAPHHTCSPVALTGGGSNPMPGEVSLAHHGILFLDELPEYGRRNLDVLREPLENGHICISRAQGQATYPARFQLIAAMNPSPTGDVHDGRCSPDEILRYINRLSGPLLDRIDMQVEVPRLPDYTLSAAVSDTDQDSAQEAKARVTQARRVQWQRQGKLNNQLQAGELAEACQLSARDLAFAQRAAAQLKLSMRVFHRSLKVARTLADLDASVQVGRSHLSEAMQYRALDRLIGQLSSS